MAPPLFVRLDRLNQRDVLDLFRQALGATIKLVRPALEERVHSVGLRQHLQLGRLAARGSDQM